MIKLSICIPTYNRAHTLVRLLSSIVQELQYKKIDDYVEIVISDNASTDNTTELVASFSSKIKNIKYIGMEKNNGFGINITNAINHARGEFCWLMGSDEVLCSGVLLKLLDIITVSNSDIILGNAITNGSERSFFINTNNINNICSVHDISRFIDNCSELSSCFAFISTIIIRKTYFDSADFPERYISHPYTHFLRIFYLLRINACNIQLLGWPLVDTGSEGNEWNSVIFNHFRLDYQTTHLICSEMYMNNVEIAHSFSKLLMRQYSPLKVTVARACAPWEEWNEIMIALTYFKVPYFLCHKTFCDPLIKFGYTIMKKIKERLRHVKS